MEEDKDKKQTLTLSGSKLTLSRPIDENFVRESSLKSSSHSAGVTVLKKKSIHSKPKLFQKAEGQSLGGVGDLTESEKNSRLEALKNLAIEREERKSNKAEKEQNKQEEIIENIEDNTGSFEEPEQENKNVDKEDLPISEQVEVESTFKEKEGHSHHGGKSFKNEDDDEEDDDKKNKKGAKLDSKIKAKVGEQRRVTNKISVQNVYDEDEEGVVPSKPHFQQRKKFKVKSNKPKEYEKIVREVIIPETITVSELSNRMSEKSSVLIKELMKIGMMVTANQVIDAQTAEYLAEILGHKHKRILESDIEKILDYVEDESALIKRPPVVTVMGHVDHGKTSLLDALRSTDVAGREAGGITQHIGAYQVSLANGEKITFIDTPGHEAFTAMRSRGAKSTDIVILLVAADDGIKAQTVEAISHAKAAGVPIIVAINKIDKPGADPDRVKNELLNHELVPEEFGGDILVVEVSAKQRIGLEKLEETILLVAEMLDLKANASATSSGVVIEAKVDKGRGVVTTFLVQRGTLNVGDIIVAGKSCGRVKSIANDKGQKIEHALPSSPVEVLGMEVAPSAGDKFYVVQSEKIARDIADYRLKAERDKANTGYDKATIADMFTKASSGIEQKNLNFIIKGDVQGSVEAIISSVAKLEHEEVKVKVIHSAVGGITESDINLAALSKAFIAGFNVRANNEAKLLAEKLGVNIRYYSIIYNLLDDIKAMLSGMLSPSIRENYIGTAEIRKVFNITKAGKIAGSFVTHGIIKRGSGVRLLRDDVVIHEGKLKTLKRFKDEVKEVKENYECGLAFENYEDIREGDKLEVFELIEEQRQL